MNPPMPPEQQRKLYYDGIRLFNDHEFFEAHEAWELIWHSACGPKRTFFHGMIQCTVALEHYRRSNPRGVASLYKSYQPKFKDLPAVFMGLDVETFLLGMHAALRTVVEADPLPEKGAIALDRSRTPIIELRYDPFETGEAQRYDQPARL